MGFRLPSLPYGDKIRKSGQIRFGGYNHQTAAGDGELYDCKNLSTDSYPLLSPRKMRYIVGRLKKPNGLYAHDGLYYVDGTGFYAGGEKVGEVTDTRKSFASLGAYIIIMPDKKYYNTLTGEFGDMGSAFSGSVTIKDGTFAGEEAEANTIHAPGTDLGTIFKAGDGVTISGCSKHTENNTTIIIREVDGEYLRFYENSFVISSEGDSETSVTISREIPDMDFICENENRLFGCKGDTIYASKLGDIFNFNVFDGVSTDSYSVNVGSAGDFTGCCSYLGYPVFFKEERIYKVYGNRPENYSVMGSASLGIEKGSAVSPAIAGEVLFYLTRTGVVAYSGGIPQNISLPFGGVRYRNAVGGSDGRRYYISMQDVDGRWHLFVYDTTHNLWQREDSLEVISFAYDEELYFLDADGVIWLSGQARSIPDGAESEGAVDSLAEFGDFTESNPNKKGISKLQLCLSLDIGASVRIDIQYDSDGAWREVRTISTATKRSFYLPVIPRRCDHYRIRLVGAGQWALYSLVRETYSGSEM